MGGEIDTWSSCGAWSYGNAREPFQPEAASCSHRRIHLCHLSMQSWSSVRSLTESSSSSLCHCRFPQGDAGDLLGSIQQT